MIAAESSPCRLLTVPCGIRIETVTGPTTAPVADNVPYADPSEASRNGFEGVAARSFTIATSRIWRSVFRRRSRGAIKSSVGPLQNRSRDLESNRLIIVFRVRRVPAQGFTLKHFDVADTQLLQCENPFGLEALQCILHGAFWLSTPQKVL
mgnify:CR=1 FL=1